MKTNTDRDKIKPKQIGSLIPGFLNFFETNNKQIETEYCYAPEEIKQELCLVDFALEVFLELE